MTSLIHILPPKMYDHLERTGICTRKEILNLSTWDIQKTTNMKEEDIKFLKHLVAKYSCPKIMTSEKIPSEKYIKTGCRGFDNILNGGFRIGTLTEVYGESGVGKTQLAMQVATQCGLDGSVYICTEGAFPVKRYNQLKKYFIKFTPDNENRGQMFIEHVSESRDLLLCIRVRLPKLLEQNKISLIIIDSIAAPFRVDFSDYVQRADELRELGMLLLNIAQKHSLSIIAINQVTSSLDPYVDVLPTLGLVWSNLITYRLMMKKTEKEINIQDNNNSVRELLVVFGPDIQNNTCEFVIDSDGIKTL